MLWNNEILHRKSQNWTVNKLRYCSRSNAYLTPSVRVLLHRANAEADVT